MPKLMGTNAEGSVHRKRNGRERNARERRSAGKATGKKQSDVEKINAFLERGLASIVPMEDLGSLEFVERNRILSTAESAIPGRYSSQLTPYVREWHVAFDSPEVEQITIVAGAQVSKTLFLTNALMHSVCCNPRPMLMVYPTLQDAEKFAKGRLQLLFDNNAIMGNQRTGKGNAKSNQMQINFNGGSLLLVGSNSVSALASNPIGTLLCDEVDRLRSDTSEGSAIDLAKARTRTFFDRKIVLTSTPTGKRTSQIAKEFEEGTKERYCYCCPDCWEWSELRFALLSPYKYNRKKRKVMDDELFMFCEKCGTAHSEKQLKAILAKGEFRWIAEHPERKNHRSFWLNSFVSPFIDWREIVEKYEGAKGDINKERVAMNTLLGECYEEMEVDREKCNELIEGRIRYNAEVPDGCETLVAGIDTQDNYFQIGVYGYGKECGFCCIENAKIEGVPSDAETKRNLMKYLSREFTNRNGDIFRIQRACCDSGGHYTSTIYEYAKEWGKYPFRFVAIKGVGGQGKPFISKTEAFSDFSGKKKVPLFMLGVDAIKTKVFAIIGNDACAFPSEPEAGCDSTFFDQLLSEKVSTYRNKECFVKIHNRNEALDCCVYAIAGFRLEGIDIPEKKTRCNRQTACENEFRKPEEKVAKIQEGTPETQQKRPVATNIRRGHGFNPWRGGW